VVKKSNIKNQSAQLLVDIFTTSLLMNYRSMNFLLL
jgi:hypothetical protein